MAYTPDTHRASLGDEGSERDRSRREGIKLNAPNECHSFSELEFLIKSRKVIWERKTKCCPLPAERPMNGIDAINVAERVTLTLNQGINDLPRCVIVHKTLTNSPHLHLALSCQF